ncbi:hypothetical protein MtrunA17_Chr5g0433441 [Medicago truncatula]|uniref:Nodule Cysteine-Rich (NCR) secreted peptide n=1 Tax=Medicago truncatula TaxID=3880 RepID=A0A072UFK5_MEDTR|nr:Nodule Cysteine-Rich (NCR) secreted peptide [Medicago truncatula]RHN56806.1 hypothetical protein MtrunA17_Chr5g0433441 [Medicago truncatula]
MIFYHVLITLFCYLFFITIQFLPSPCETDDDCQEEIGVRKICIREVCRYFAKIH